MLIVNALVYLLSFALIWLGSGLLVSTITVFSRRLRLSQFMFSFVFLGLLSSIPDFSVGLQALFDQRPEIFIGNFIGSAIVIFLFIIPLLAVLGKGISLQHELEKNTLLTVIAVLLAPSIFILDKSVTVIEGITLLILYLVLFFLVERQHGIFDRDNSRILNLKVYSYKDLLKIIAGILIVYFSSNMIVEKTIYFGNVFNISPFYLSLVLISVGTNLPELTLAIRSIVSGQKNLAMGGFMGSASANVFLFGLFTILNRGEVLTVNNFIVTFIFLSLGLSAFYLLSVYKKYISRSDGLILLAVYVCFLILELVRR